MELFEVLDGVMTGNGIGPTSLMRLFPEFLHKRGVATEGHPYNYALAIIAFCVGIFLSIQLVQAQDSTQEPAGATVRGQVVYSDTGRPLRHAGLRLANTEVRWSPLVAETDRRASSCLRMCGRVTMC
ncbi:MAG TPA: hypothetical protein VIT88_12415 [Pyrinomonadaceae bacterium]